MTQEQALSIMRTGANVFLTGEPGSGKTYTVNAFVSWLREHGIKPAITASTGIAATHIGGFTIHSWSGIGVRSELTKHDIQYMLDNKKLKSRVRDARTLIIDEISMLSARTLGLVDTACQKLRESPAPFGGLQVILVGDFFQLPPVVTAVENEPLSVPSEELFESQEMPQARFAFDSPSWTSLNPVICYLDEQHRQGDPEFLELLAAIRNRAVGPEHRKLLGDRFSASPAEIVPKLFSHNANVDRVNALELEKLPGEARLFTMETNGPKALIEQLKKGCLSPAELFLKIDAPVMFTKNDYLQHQYVNGTLGTVVGFSEEDQCPIIETKSGARIYADRAEWRIEDGERVLARISQIPLRLAWAITIHKSQGMSLDAAHLDLRGAFEHGQGYVALSRVRTLGGLTLAGWNERALEVHPDIAAKDARFRALSRAVLKKLTGLSAEELLRRQEEFIKISGGTLQKPEKPDTVLPDFAKKKYSLEDLRRRYPNAYQSWTENDDA
ncbi:MAG: AAA family ATPase, partial [Patescibacteria group bacterium]|nr:AAA family ATPase [Patescibacteria group bacterium]